jgi:hypothetical protein
MDEVPFGPLREAPGFGFIIWYYPKLKVLRDWFVPVSIGVGRANNSDYFFLRLLVWFDMFGRGSWVYFKSRS